MHYYKFNIGDYRKKTAHLTLFQHGIYRLMLDTYYIRQQPFPEDFKEIARLLNLKTKRELEGLRLILKDHFVLLNCMYYQKRCDEEIEKFTGKSAKARASANSRWDKENANALRTECERNANHKPLTINHKPLTKPILRHSPEDRSLAGRIYNGIKLVAPKTKEPNWEKWCNSVRLMREQDKYGYEEIINVFIWANKDEFWKTNILSVDKLRKQFPQLSAKMKQEQNYGTTNNTTSKRFTSNAERSKEAIDTMFDTPAGESIDGHFESLV